MPNELKPCPFCGGEAEVTYDDTPVRIIVMCTSCEVRTDWFYNRDTVINLWNMRVNDGN